VVRRAIVFTVLALSAATAAHAQPITSEDLGPPPGDTDSYGAPPARPDGAQPYGAPRGGYGAPADTGADQGDDPYADPSSGGVYDPSTRSVTGPTRLPGPGGAPSYGTAPAGPPESSPPPAYGRSAPPPSYGAPTGAPPSPYGRPAAPAYGAPAYGAPAYGEPSGVRSSCDDLAAELQRFRGPPEDPMRPRDQACAATRTGGDPGRPNEAFRQCSDNFFRQYEAKRDEYRRCMEEDASKGDQRLEQRATTAEAARSGYGGTAPQMAGRFARAGAPGWLGVQIAPMTPQSAYRLGTEALQGAYVINAVMGSPAQIAGLRRGDVIVAFDGEAIDDPKDLQYHAERLTAGQQVRLEIVRNGQRQTLNVQITQRP
jgi:hypothetical protein